MIRKAKVEIRKASGGKDPIEREGNQMKAILISIQPQYVKDILNGRKTIEIRKTMPKCDLPIDVYIYCTKKEPYARRCVHNDKWGTLEYIKSDGKVVAKFTLNKVGNFIKEIFGTYEEPFTYNQDDLLKKSCLTEKELDIYLKGKQGYAWHIDNLVIFDKPKEISEFRQWFDCEKCWCVDNQDCLMNKQCPKHTLTRAPQSWQFIEV